MTINLGLFQEAIVKAKGVLQFTKSTKHLLAVSTKLIQCKSELETNKIMPGNYGILVVDVCCLNIDPISLTPS